MTEAYRIILELHIPEGAPLEVKIINFGASVCNTKIEVTRVQVELNLKITKLELKSQHTTPP